MVTALAVLTDANPATAFWVLVGCTASITVIAVVLAFVVLGQHRASHNHAGDMAAAAEALADAGRALAKANADLVRATAWGSRLADENTRLRDRLPKTETPTVQFDRSAT